MHSYGWNLKSAVEALVSDLQSRVWWNRSMTRGQFYNSYNINNDNDGDNIENGDENDGGGGGGDDDDHGDDVYFNP